MPNSKPSSQNSSRDILAHVELYGLTTVEAVAREFFSGNRRRASVALRKHVARGTLFRHQSLFTMEKKLPARRNMFGAYATLAYCCLGARKRPMLSHEAIARLTGRVTARVGIPPVRHAKCYLHGSRRLAVIRVYPGRRPKNDFEYSLALKRLQQFAHTDEFRPWAYFAVGNGLILTYLVPSGSLARELSTWLARKPLVSRLVKPAVIVPVEVHACKRPPGKWRSR